MEIATSVLPLFAGNDQYEIMSCEVTENRLYLKVVNHRLEMEVRKGDIVQAGVMISNSEVGLGAVSIRPLVYRLVCTNGMVVNDMGERRHHVGRQAKAVEDSFALYSDETMEAEDKAFLLKLRDTTMAAIDEARFAQVVGRLQESMAVPITSKVQDVVQLTSQSYGINADEQEGILKYLIAGGDLSLYGLSNAVTRASQDVASYDVLTKGSGDAREQPLFFLITTAGTDKESICYELHMKALDLLAGRKIDHTFYPVVYGLTDEDDWHDEANWYKANPSLGQTIQIQRVRDAYQEALDNPAEENVFKQLRLNMWVSSLTRFIPEHIYDLGNEPIDMEALKGRDCYGGLDLSSTGDITAFVLIFPPRTPDEKYILLPFFWIPEDTIPQRVRRASVPYDVWYQQGYLMATEGNVIHYGFIEKIIEELGNTYHIREIAFGRWGAVQMTQNLEGMGFTVVPFGQGFKDMSPPTKEFYKLLMEGRIVHGGNPIMAWMAGNVVVDTDPAGNIKPTKAKSPEKIDGIVAAIMALDRCIRNEGQQQGSIYDERDMIVF